MLSQNKSCRNFPITKTIPFYRYVKIKDKIAIVPSNPNIEEIKKELENIGFEVIIIEKPNSDDYLECILENQLDCQK